MSATIARIQIERFSRSAGGLGEDGGVKSTLLSRRDLDFLLYEWLRVDELTKRERFAEHSRETFDGVLDLCEQLATRYFAPHNKKSDANEPSFDGETGHRDRRGQGGLGRLRRRPT